MLNANFQAFMHMTPLSCTPASHHHHHTTTTTTTTTDHHHHCQHYLYASTTRWFYTIGPSHTSFSCLVVQLVKQCYFVSVTTTIPSYYHQHNHCCLHSCPLQSPSSSLLAPPLPLPTLPQHCHYHHHASGAASTIATPHNYHCCRHHH